MDQDTQDSKDSTVKEQNQGESRSEQVDLSFLLDILLQVTVELGRARVTIEKLLKLNQGSVVELGHVVGEPLDIYVNNKLVARGEAVVLKEKFGVRITDVISPQKRLENLRSATG